MDFFNDIFHNLALLEFYFLNIIYILLYIDFILSIFFQHSNILTRASHHWCLASNIVLVLDVSQYYDDKNLLNSITLKLTSVKFKSDAAILTTKLTASSSLSSSSLWPPPPLSQAVHLEKHLFYCPANYCFNWYFTEFFMHSTKQSSVFCMTGPLTHWGRDKMDAISQTTFSNGFSWMEMYELRLRFHWSLFPRVQSTIFRRNIYQRIYASLGLNELTHWGQGPLFMIWINLNLSMDK